MRVKNKYYPINTAITGAHYGKRKEKRRRLDTEKMAAHDGYNVYGSVYI